MLQGTLLRTACALGWQAAFLLPGCCDVFNDKALRAGRGAAFKLPLARGSWQDLRRVLAAHQLIALAAHPRDTTVSAGLPCVRFAELVAAYGASQAVIC